MNSSKRKNRILSLFFQKLSQKDLEKISNLDPETKELIKNRWKILFGGFLLSLMGGMSYAWGSFVVPLRENWGWTTTQANMPFTVMIVVFAIAMIPAGWVQDKIGPRKVAFVGALLFLIGYAMSGLLRFFPYPFWLIITYGFIVGLACGLTYACIAPTARKWYPDRPGFAVSTGVMGFGLAAVIFAPLKKSMISLWDVDGSLFVMGILVTIVALIGASIIKNPPDNYTIPDSLHAKNKGFRSSTTENINPARFVKMPVFYLLWIALAMVIGGGLTAIGLLTPYGELKLGLPAAIAAMAMSAYAFVNGLGRPVAGYFADRIGTLNVMIIIYTIQAIVFIALPFVAVNLFLLILCSLLLGMGYATTFALFPVVVAAKFGTKYLGINYGLVFSAFGLGAITSLMGSWLLDKTGSFTPAFLLAGITSIIGLLIIMSLKKGDKN